MSKTPKILIFDIETSYSVMANFGIFNQNIPYKNILHEWYMICACWKYLDKPKIYSTSVLKGKNPDDDYIAVKELREVILGCDALVAHNGLKFDLKKLNTRILYHGLEPLPPITMIDTLKVARKEFAFTSNRLDYIANYLAVGSKLPTTSGLWLEALKGNKKAIKEMLFYCRNDVVILEEVYKKLKPYISNHPNMVLFDDDNFEGCRNCGSKNIQKRGFSYTLTTKKQRYQCLDCFSWGNYSKSEKISKTK